MRLGSRPCDCRCGVTIQRHRRPGSLLHPEPFRAPDLDLSLHPTLPGDDHSGIMLTVKYLRLRRQREWTFRSAYPFLRIRICVTLNLYPPMCPFQVIRTRKLTKTHPACLFLQIRTCGVVLRVCVCLFLPNRTRLRQIFSTFVRFFTILSKAKGLESLDSSPFRLVRAGGVEPPRAYTHCHLKTARLPFRHARRQSTNLHLYYLWCKSACRD